jgi:hypothetical protein
MGINIWPTAAAPCWCVGLEVIQQQVCQPEGTKVVAGYSSLKATVNILVGLQERQHQRQDGTLCVTTWATWLGEVIDCVTMS